MLNAKIQSLFKTLKKFLHRFGQTSKNNWNFYRNSGFGAEPRLLANFFSSSLYFLLATLFFPQRLGRAHGSELKIRWLAYYGDLGASTPELQRKFQFFRKKRKDLMSFNKLNLLSNFRVISIKIRIFRRSLKEFF